MAEETSSVSAIELPRRQDIESGLRQARSSLDELDRQARTLVRERPFLALMIALAAGYLTGRVLSRL